MKSINLVPFLLFMLLAMAPARSEAQCAGGLFAGTLTPTTSYQVVPCALAGEYYTFAATVGATYTFSYCNGGGNGNGVNTYITILDNAGVPVPGAFNDNACFPVSAEIVWVATATATFRVRTSQPAPGCLPSATCLSLAYRMTNPPGPGVNCGNPMIIGALPYTNSGLTTCGNGNTYTSAHACGSTYMNGEDFIFRYTSPGNECINLSLTGTSMWVGLFVYNGCPNIVGTTCVAQATSGAGNPTLSNVSLTAPGTYYFLVSTLPPPNCTAFNISVSRCPTGTTCGYSREIPSLPYVQNTLTTCGFGNDYNSTHACLDPYMNGEDFIFSYTIPTAPRCVDIYTTGTSNWAGLFVYNGCPSTVGTTCVASNVSIFGNPTLVGVVLPTPGTYYFMVDTRPMPNCTPFDFRVDSCQPPTPCGLNPPATNACNGATNISNYSSFCGNTDTLQYSPDGPGNLPSTFCGTIENNSWFSFVADTSVVHFFFNVSNCYFGNGIQAQVFSTPDCNNFTAVSNCFNPGSQSNGTITATGLVVGQTYYLMVDGYASDDCEYFVTWDGGPLPVEFGDLSALLVDGKVHVNWETESESNCKGFYIERGSPDPGREVNGFLWETAGYVEGHGSTSMQNAYYFVDGVNPTEEMYYRIREVDFDGFSSYSEILNVSNVIAEGNQLLELYPNPTRDRLYISFGIAHASAASFRLLDMSGKLVQQMELGAFEMGTYYRTVELAHLPSGVYLYDIILGTQRFHGKLVVAH